MPLPACLDGNPPGTPRRTHSSRTVLDDRNSRFREEIAPGAKSDRLRLRF
jgi:hypothetical protein